MFSFKDNQNNNILKRRKKAPKEKNQPEKPAGQIWGVSIDQLVHLEDDIPKEVTVEDKGLIERVKLIQELDEKDRSTIFSIIDTMLTKQKFKDFFNKNAAML